MLKIFNTQLNGIFSKIDAQVEEIEIASQLLMQAIAGEGHIYIKSFDDLSYFSDYIVNSAEQLPSSKKINILADIKNLDTTDRVLLIAPFITNEVSHWINELNHKDIDFVLISNKDKENKTHEQLMHYVDLQSPRAIVPTADFSKIITPHTMAINYIYYIMFAEIYEMKEEPDDLSSI